MYGWLAFRAAIWFQGRSLSAALADQEGLRAAVISMIAFLVSGFVLQLFVNVQRAQHQILKHDEWTIR